MVNASLNWASIVGIVLAVSGAGLYFMRTFKPALARDYDVFFAAIGLLCGGILFFQGWRLDPILQFGQFLLAGTTVFFAYESVRLRGVTADQARRSSYFDDEPDPPRMDRGINDRNKWDDSYDQFEEPLQRRRRFSGQDLEGRDRRGDDMYRPRRTSRAAIPENAASRRNKSLNDLDPYDSNSDRSRRMARFSGPEDDVETRPSFGERRNFRQDLRRGTRPLPNNQNRGMRDRESSQSQTQQGSRLENFATQRRRPGIPKGTPLNAKAEDVAFQPSRSRKNELNSSVKSNQQYKKSSRGSENSFINNQRSENDSARRSRPRDNSSRFDD